MKRLSIAAHRETFNIRTGAIPSRMAEIRRRGSANAPTLEIAAHFEELAQYWDELVRDQPELVLENLQRKVNELGKILKSGKSSAPDVYQALIDDYTKEINRVVELQK